MKMTKKPFLLLCALMMSFECQMQVSLKQQEELTLIE